MRSYWLAVPALALAVELVPAAAAEKNYGPGVSDTEIKLGQTMPYSGPASAYGTIGKAEAAYFAMINDQGGVNGRKIKLISLDDGYSPPKTVEQTRRLVEQEGVLLDFNPLGTPPNTAIQKYLNEKQVPQLFVATGATKWGDPEHFPWTMGWQPTYQTEGHIFAKYLLEHQAQRPDRRALSERRLRQGLCEGPQGRARRQGEEDDRRRGELRGHRSHHRLADRHRCRPRAPTSSST